jgi:hypothetical protein
LKNQNRDISTLPDFPGFNISSVSDIFLFGLSSILFVVFYYCFFLFTINSGPVLIVQTRVKNKGEEKKKGNSSKISGIHV